MGAQKFSHPGSGHPIALGSPSYSICYKGYGQKTISFFMLGHRKNTPDGGKKILTGNKLYSI
jgi:hypothetical protein